MDFKTSRTRENLMRAFAGESQARNRYTFAAAAAKRAGLEWVERVFLFTAGQEKEHAEVFLSHLAQCEGESIRIDAGYPVENTAWTPERLLRSAQHNEYEEAHSVYPAFAAIAREEGFPAIAASFELIAKVEKTHGDRFGQLAERAGEGRLFTAEKDTVWLCLNCGHIHTGKEAPALCPLCRHGQGYFVRVETGEILVQDKRM
ncbi:MAG: rubrerythrin family protein [Clostridia bacterium]|nr:rubrerythrin family protein [Clostridia bacterium]